MSCPFGYSSLDAARKMEQAQSSNASSSTQPSASASAQHEDHLATPSKPSHAVNSNNTSPAKDNTYFSQSPYPLRLFTGGMRTSLGVENHHALAVWLKEMANKEDAENKEGSAESNEPLLEKHKNWKQKRDHPPIQMSPKASDDECHKPRFHESVSPSKYTQEITYWDYIHPHVLTSLQTGREGKGLNHHDEHLFILVHQVFELWFKQILWELEYVRNCLVGYRDESKSWHEYPDNYLSRCNQRLARADKILRLATSGYEIMETMNPSDFLEFRDFLSPSSGFQSVQLRELEIMMGLNDHERLPCAGRHYREAFMANGQDMTGTFDMRLREKSLKDSIYEFLARMTPTLCLDQFLDAYFDVIQTQNSEKSKDFEEELTLLEKMANRTSDPKELAYLKDLVEKAQFGRKFARNSSQDVEKFFRDPQLGKQRTAILFLFTYHSHPFCEESALLLNQLLAFEQAFILWRTRHARMVEVFIGRRQGTGGTSGVEYIDSTATQYRIFTDMWRIRSLVVARSKLHFNPDQGIINYDLHHLNPTSVPPLTEQLLTSQPPLQPFSTDRAQIMRQATQTNQQQETSK